MLKYYSPYTVSQASSLINTVVNNESFNYFLPSVFAVLVGGGERELFVERAVVTLVVDGDVEAANPKKILIVIAICLNAFQLKKSQM